MNAAYKLAEIFTQWRDNPQASVYNARGALPGEEQTLAYWLKYQNVVELLSDLDYALDALDAKGKPRLRYDQLMVRSWRYTVLPEVGWQGPNKTQVALDDIIHLQTLGDVIEVHVPEANRMPEPDRKVVRGLLEEAERVALECVDLPSKIRTRLSDLLSKLGDLLDPENDVNPRAVQRALDETTSILLRAVWSETKPDLKYKLLNLALRFGHSAGESASYDAIKAIAAAPVNDMLGLPPGAES